MHALIQEAVWYKQYLLDRGYVGYLNLIAARHVVMEDLQDNNITLPEEDVNEIVQIIARAMS